MTSEEQAIIDKAATKSAAIKATIAEAAKPKSTYQALLCVEWRDDAGKDCKKLADDAIDYLAHCKLSVVSIQVVEVLP